MNLGLTNVLSNVTGVTGLAIIQHIITGERNPHKLAASRGPRGHNGEAEIAAWPRPRRRPYRPLSKNDHRAAPGTLRES